MEHILKSRYRIVEKLSENPFSVTYKGVLIGTEKPVIVKIYKRGTLTSSLIREMKLKVRDLSLINHHGIAKLLDGDYGWQGFYYVREFIEGRCLREILEKEKALGAEKAVAVADQALAALETTHSKGILHAALKPSNIFVDNQGLVKLADFIIEGEIKEALPQKVLEVMTNAKYASPEELIGKPLSPASDLFSLGMILYEMVAGKPVWVEEGLAANILKSKASLPSNEVLSGLPRYLADIIVKALQREPRLRFETASDFRESLERKGLFQKPRGNEDLLRIFESAVTQYGGEEVDQESEELQELGRIRIRWSKEKHRSWILAVVLGASVILGILYAFFFGR